VWHRAVTLLADAGCLRIDDRGFLWQPREGNAERQEASDAERGGALVGHQVRRMLERRDHAPAPDTARLLALCEAARLSCRTGHGETPSRMLEMSSRL